MTTLERIAELHRELAAAYEELGRENRPNEPAPTWVKLKEFCDTHDLGESTVRRYIREGMPHKLLGARNIRINVPAAEEWLNDRGVAHRKRERAA